MNYPLSIQYIIHSKGIIRKNEIILLRYANYSCAYNGMRNISQIIFYVQFTPNRNKLLRGERKQAQFAERSLVILTRLITLESESLMLHEL